MKDAFKTKAINIYGDGTQTRDFLYIDDLIEAIYLVSCSKKTAGEVFQVATGIETDVNKLAFLIKKCFQEKIQTNINLNNVESPHREVLRNYSDPNKIKKIIGWQSKVKIEEGINLTFNSFLNKFKTTL